jgi:transposase-like protein
MHPLGRRLSVEDASRGIRQVKYVNDIVEQDQKAVKRVTRRMLGFKERLDTKICDTTDSRAHTVYRSFE